MTLVSKTAHRIRAAPGPWRRASARPSAVRRELAAEGIGARQKGVGVGRRGRYGRLQDDDNLTVQAAAMRSGALLEPQIERIGHPVDGQGRRSVKRSIVIPLWNLGGYTTEIKPVDVQQTS